MNKKLLSIIVIILLILVAYWYLNQSGTSSETSLVAQTQTAQSADAQNIYSLLQKMSQVQLNDQIFSNQTFVSLLDNSVTLTEQPTGRANPFAPLGTGGALSTTSTPKSK
jgi:uncharacterized protein (UPF0333 family)